MQRTKSTDILRIISLLLIMIYHAWILGGMWPFHLPVMSLLVPLGGEIGVTSFFALSGYGIYVSLKQSEENCGKIDYLSYIKKRARRIIPQYYFVILVKVVFSIKAFLSIDGLINILTHLFFIHNLFPQYHGAINGVLWTMGVTVQYYIVAPLLYKGFKKFGAKMELFCILVTILSKYLVYAWLLPYIGRQDLAFFSGRQLLTSLDNFSIGMFIAYLVYDKKIARNKITGGIGLVISICELVFICQKGMIYGIHTNNLSGYIWHSLIALGIGGIILALSMFHVQGKWFPLRGILWIAKWEYGIYIWHLYILRRILASSMWTMADTPYAWTICLLYIPLSVICGYLISIFIDRIIDISRKIPFYLRKNHT